jgi:hypothetical protein
MVYPRGETNHKRGWLVHIKNVKNDRFYNFVGVSHICQIQTLAREFIIRLFSNYTKAKINESPWSRTDCKRPLYLDEYMDLEFALKKQGFIYNKKTDKLTTV